MTKWKGKICENSRKKCQRKGRKNMKKSLTKRRENEKTNWGNFQQKRISNAKIKKWDHYTNLGRNSHFIPNKYCRFP